MFSAITRLALISVLFSPLFAADAKEGILHEGERNDLVHGIALNSSDQKERPQEEWGNWVTFGEKEDRERFANCFLISYPDSLIVDPASGVTPKPFAKDVKIPEENLHSLVLHDDKNSLEIRAATYGFLTREFYVPRGFKSPREVILTDYFGNALKMKITSTQDYDLFYSESENKVVALYLNRNADWGQCFQTLTFSFHKGATLEEHKKLVGAIIEKFVPCFARQD